MALETESNEIRPPKGLRCKPKLTVREQIAHLKAKGVTFDLCSEEEAAAYLSDRTYYFKLAAYRTLFQRRIGGRRDGQYVGLDFGHLHELASLDRTLRYTLLPMTLDVEHFAKVKLIREATEREGEDGYALVSDYMASLNHNERRRRKGEIHALERDAYCGALTAKYALPYDMPLWVFLELVSFGTFISLYLFCAERWGDNDIKLEHYLLRQAQSIRNATAHSSNIINGFADSDGTITTSSLVSRAVAETGVSRRVRTAKLHNPRLRQIATLFYLHKRIVPEGTGRNRARGDTAILRATMKRTLTNLDGNDAVRSSFDFIIVLLDAWF